MIYAGFEFIKRTMSKNQMKYLADTIGIKLRWMWKINTLSLINVLIQRMAYTRLTYLIVIVITFVASLEK